MAKAKPRPRQQHFEGMEPPKIEAIERLAEAYVSIRNERMRLTEQEVAKRDLLLAKLHEHELTRYEFDGKVIEIVGSEKVKVNFAKDGEDEESIVDKGRRHLSGKAAE